jgi:hypothetical protein
MTKKEFGIVILFVLTCVSVLLARTSYAGYYYGDLSPGVETGIDGTTIVAPTANPGAGTYAEAQNVTLTATGANAICYATAGTVPVCAYSGTACTTGTVYVGAVGIGATTSLRAISCYPNGHNSGVVVFNYTILGTPGGPAGGAPGGAGPAPEEEEKPSTDDGEVTATSSLGGETTLTNPDGGSAYLDVPEGAVSEDTDFTVEVIPEDEMPDVPEGLFMLAGQRYQFTAEVDGDSVTEFDEPLTITFTYTDEQLGDMDEETLQIYYYDADAEEWIPLDTDVDTENNTATVTIDHLTIFALLGEVLEGDCSCATWEDDECGGGDCDDDEMHQIRTCTPSGCAPESRCVADEECEAPLDIEALRARILELLALIAQAQARLAELTGEAVIAGVPAGFSFESDLEMGMASTDVKYLQIVLNSDSDTRLANTGVGSPGNETNYFGSLTKEAVIKFQEKYYDDVLAPWGFSSGTGFVGTTTREKLNELLGQ